MSKVSVDIATLVEIQIIAEKLLRQPSDVIGLARKLHALLLPYEQPGHLQRNGSILPNHSVPRVFRTRHSSVKLQDSPRQFDAIQNALFSTTTTATGLPKEEPGPIKTKRLLKVPKDKSPISTPVGLCNGHGSYDYSVFKNRGRRRTCPNLPQVQKFSFASPQISRKKYWSASTEHVNGDLSWECNPSCTPPQRELRDISALPHRHFEPCQISIITPSYEDVSDSNNALNTFHVTTQHPNLIPNKDCDPEDKSDGSRWFHDYQEDLLFNVNDWNFQIFQLADKTENVLSQMAFKIFQSTGLFDTFKIPKYEFVRFMQALESGYKSIPYHNKVHAADVLHGCWFLTTQEVPGFQYHFPHCNSDSDSDSGSTSMNAPQVNDIAHASLAQAIPALELMALYLAAAMHDYDHPGKTNAFLVETRHPLANVYNDRSVLENHHASASWDLLYSNENFNFLRNLETAEWKRLRFLIVEAILATDLKKHFEILSQFSSKAQTPPFTSTSIENQIAKNPEKSNLNWSENEHRLLICQMVIKLADISGPAKARPLHITWTKAICEEFFLQGNVERRLNMPVSPFMDQDKPQVAELQRTFINNLISPVLLSMHCGGILAGEVQVDDEFYSNEKLPREQNLLIEHLKSNLNFWKTTLWKDGYDEMFESFKYAIPHRFNRSTLLEEKFRNSYPRVSKEKTVNGFTTDDEDDVFDRMAVATLSSCTNIFNKSEKGRRSRRSIKKDALVTGKDFIQNCSHVDSSLNKRQVETAMTSR